MTGGLATATFYVVSKPRESSQMGQEYGASADVAHESSMRVTFGPDALISALFHAPAERGHSPLFSSQWLDKWFECWTMQQHEPRGWIVPARLTRSELESTAKHLRPQRPGRGVRDDNVTQTWRTRGPRSIILL
jgi:hypothetical protein